MATSVEQEPATRTDPLPPAGLCGSLRTMALADLLQWMGAGKKTGAVHLEREKVTTRIYFREGRVVGCSSEDPSRLIGQFLLFHGIITEGTLRRAMSQHEATGRTLPDVLLDHGDITVEEFREQLALKAEETMLGLFEWEDGAFRFFPGVPPDAKTTRAYHEVHDLLLQGMKRIDDRNRIRAIFHDPELVIRRTSREPPPRMSAQWSTRQIYQAIEGGESVGEIVLRVHGTDFQVTKCLFEMLQEGLIEIVAPHGPSDGPAPPPPPPAADEAHPSSLVLDEARRLLEQGDFEKAMARVEAAYSRDPSDAHLRSLYLAAEAGFVARIAREDLPPHKLPVLSAAPRGRWAGELSSAEECLLDLSDGTRDVRSLTWVVPLRAADVLIALKRLLERGVIELRDPG